jgi:8-oxo-dGTP diphosphatase
MRKTAERQSFQFYAKIKEIMKYAFFNVSFKLILRKNNKILALTESATGFLDFPGGRIEKNEIKLPIKDLFKREIVEELGRDVKYKIMGPAIQYRRYNKYTKMHVLITAYEAKYLSGQIKLSGEHSKYEWVDPNKYNLRNKKINNEEEKSAFESYFKTF